MNKQTEMKRTEFIDYYEVLEISPNATSETVERIFRYFGQRLHPDNQETGNDEQFRILLEAYTTLRDADKRVAYDVKYAAHQKQAAEIVKGAAAVSGDNDDRHRLLSLFYGQRRRDMKNPGVGVSTLEKVMGCPTEVLDFHLWYFREKKWIAREENGLFAITIGGIDRIEDSEQKLVAKDRAITMQAHTTNAGEIAAQRRPLRAPATTT